MKFKFKINQEKQQERIKFYQWYRHNKGWRENVDTAITLVMMICFLVFTFPWYAIAALLSLVWGFWFWVMWCAKERYRESLKNKDQTFHRNDIWKKWWRD